MVPALAGKAMGNARAAEVICRAIRQGRCLRLNYDNYSRVIEPYALGADGSGTEILCGYQVSGGDAAGTFTGWKRLEVAAIMGATVIDSACSGERALPAELAPVQVCCAVRARRVGAPAPEHRTG